MPMTLEQKRKRLIEFAETFPINYIPGFTNIVTVDSKYIKVSDNALNLIGYKSLEQLFNTNYCNMPCRACENAENFQNEDRIALTQEIKILSYHYFDKWTILLGHKKPIYYNNETIGTIANFIDITDCQLIDIARFLLNKKHSITRKQFSFTIQNADDYCGLTKREQECLFFFIRGYSYKEIAKILNIAITTVETYIDHIKIKYTVSNRSQIIEKAIFLGFINFIPASLFK